MPIIIDETRVPQYPEGKSYYIKLYSKIIVENLPELEPFRIFNIPSMLNFEKDDRDRFLHIQSEIKTWLLDKRLIKHQFANSNSLLLVMDAKEILSDLNNPKKDHINSTTNIFATNSNVIHKSHFDNSPINFTHDSPKLATNENVLVKIWNYISSNSLIAGVIILAITSVAIYFGYLI